jgi:hypothetical protein
LLLLIGVPSDHLILVALHLFLSTLLGSLLLNTQYHVSLGLLHFQRLNASHFPIFINHTLYHVVNLFFLLLVLLIRFFLYFLAVRDLFLKHLLSLSLLFYLLGLSFTFDLLLNFFVAQHDTLHLSVVLLKTQVICNINYLLARSIGGTVIQLFRQLVLCLNNWR